MNVLSLFDGMSCGQIALEKAGIKVGDMLYEIEFNGARYLIDEFGDVSVPWRSGTKISFEELLVRCRIGDPLLFVVYRNGERHELNGTFESPKLKPVRTIYPEYEQDELDYEMFGGLVVMLCDDAAEQPSRPNHRGAVRSWSARARWGPRASE